MFNGNAFNGIELNGIAFNKITLSVLGSILVILVLLFLGTNKNK